MCRLVILHVDVQRPGHQLAKRPPFLRPVASLLQPQSLRRPGQTLDPMEHNGAWGPHQTQGHDKCPFYSIEFGVTSHSHVQWDMLCPDPLPSI